MEKENSYVKYTEIHDSTLRSFAESFFTKEYMKDFFISALVRNGDKWIVKLEKI